ncbi:MAG: plasmid pRiA4b ORF-3 family protein [Anaerolineae bacterium]|nr:plasmid pRiA4b ORF-3 family protein [Anaerolineae bacterium]
MPSETAIYQIKVTLEDSKPPIWRRILVRSDITLDKLHRILQVVMGWGDYHLHQFIVGRTHYGEPHPDYEGFLEMHDERQVKLNQIVPGEGFKFRYEYDFGDSWLHQVLVEKILPSEPGQHYPVCIKGQRACPPEDVGGIWGYYDFLQAIQDPHHPEHDEYLEWIGGEFDPEEFDLDEVNQALRTLR